MSRADTICRRCRQPASTCDVDPDTCRLLLHKLGRCGMDCEHCPDDDAS